MLRQQRQIKDKNDADRAKEESGSMFSSEYSYRKGSRPSINLVRDSVIAKKYRAKHGQSDV